jgi:hypothetical protein
MPRPKIEIVKPIVRITVGATKVELSQSEWENFFAQAEEVAESLDNLRRGY